MRLRWVRHVAVLMPVLAGCDSNEVSAPEGGICLYETGSCSYGALGGACPPGPGEFTTVCVDTPARRCPEVGVEVSVDAAMGQAYAEYVQNPREVTGVTCEDYAHKPALDPEPRRTTCATEFDGVCDAPERCPDGTDMFDCLGAPCEAAPPDDYECDYYGKDLRWCTNLEGGSRCAVDGQVWVCDGDVWVAANVLDIDALCHMLGSVGYSGCTGAYDEFVAYCQ